MTSATDETEGEKLAGEMKRAAQAQLILNFETAAPAKWAAAVDLLVATGEFDAAGYAARQMLVARRDFAYAHNVTDVLDRIPAAADAETLAFKDDLRSEVQIVPRQGADIVIIVFGAYAHGAGVALSVAHRWFRQLPVSLVYLRDFRHLFFRDGVPTLGAGREATIARLRGIVRSLGASRVLCYGYSSGAFAALHYGLDLSARTVLAISGVYNLTPDFAVPRDVRSKAYRNHPISRQAVDLCELYARAPNPPQALLLYGDGNPVDRAHAEHMAGARNVELVATENCDSHLLVVELIRRGVFADLLRRFAEQ